MRVDKLPVPKRGTIIVKALDIEEQMKTEGGIWLPNNQDSQKSSFFPAEVIAVGGDMTKENSKYIYKMQTKVGEKISVLKVIFTQSANFFYVGDNKYYQIFEEDYFFNWLDK